MGSYHDKNQDHFLCRPYRDGYLLVVSDGLGSKKFSHYGSKAVCRAAFDVLNDPRTDLRVIDFKDVMYIIHEKWLRRLIKYDVSDCMATLLVAAVIDGAVYAGRIGDGFLGVYTDDTVKCLFDAKEDRFFNETDCLYEKYDRGSAEVYTARCDKFHGVIACTDGIEIGEMQNSDLEKFTRDFIDAHKNTSRRAVMKTVRDIAHNWTGTDDKTMAFVIKNGD